MNKKELVQKFCDELIENATDGKQPTFAMDSLDTLINTEAEELKNTIIATAKIRRKTIVQELQNNVDLYRTEYKKAKEKLDKYETDIQKLESFKKSFK